LSRLNISDEDESEDFIQIKTPDSFYENFQKNFESGYDDPFLKDWQELSKLDGINPNFKRKVNRIEKAYTGQSGAKSKKLDPLDLTGYSLFQIVQPPYNLLYLAQLYDLSPFHHSAINAKTENVVGLGYKFVETRKTLNKIEDAAGDDDKLDKLRRRIAGAKEDLRDFIESLNSDDSFLWIMKKIYVDLETTGNGYLEVGRTATGAIGYIGHIPSITMRIRRHRDGFVQVVYNRYTFFRNFGDTETQDQIGTDPQPNEVIHFKKYTPTNTYYGFPDILSAKNAIAGDEFASRYNLDYFENKAVPRYIITVKGARLSPDSERKLLEFFQTGLRGRHHRTLYIPLPSDGENSRVEFNMEPIEANTQEASFSRYTEENLNRILIANSVPITKIGGTSSINNAAALASDKTFKEQVCRPAQDSLEQKIDLIVKEFTDAFVLRFEELTLTDEMTQNNIDANDLRFQVITPNEVRIRKGLQPRPGGDSPLVVFPSEVQQEMFAEQEQQAKVAIAQEGTKSKIAQANAQARVGVAQAQNGVSAQQSTAPSQARAEVKAQAAGSRTRDVQRKNNASDTQTGRNPKGTGRKTQ
jgi:PBSX family phage portal protein